LEKQSIETFKDMRGCTKRDSVDTAKEGKRTTMLTISEVFGMKQGKKGKKVIRTKPKTVRPNSSQKNLKSRLKTLRTSLKNDKFDLKNVLKFNTPKSKRMS
jgi:TRAP-type uncharacterized transport system substrate-binding protein